MNKIKAHPLYATWCNIKQRCYNIKHPSYKYYGEKGITMSDAWKLSFNKFCIDMGPKPSESYSLERVENNKGYYKENCKWADKQEQSRNKSNNVKINYKGQIMCAKDWEKILGISRQTILYRHKNGIDIKEGKKNKSAEEIKKKDKEWRVSNKQVLNVYARSWNSKHPGYYNKYKKAKRELLWN